MTKPFSNSPAMPQMRRRDHLGPRFMGPPRPRRISPHHHHHKRPMHPMMVMLPNQGQQMSPMNGFSPMMQASPSTTSPVVVAANTSAASPTSEDDGLRSLLLQYASLREKITKLKDTTASPSPTVASATATSSSTAKRSSKMYSHWPKHIIKALRKRKRQSTISLKNNKMKKPSPEMLKKLKNLLANSTKLENNPKLKAKIQTYLRQLKNASGSSSKSKSRASRGGRNMKLRLTTGTSNSTKLSKTQSKKVDKGVSKSDAKKRLMVLLSAAKNKMKEDNKAAKALASSSAATSNRLTPQQNHHHQQQPRNRQMGLSLRPPQPHHQHHQQHHPVNHESHPIWNYFHRLRVGTGAPPQNRGRRLRHF